MAAEHVLIVGAAPTGLFLALALARLGAKPRIIDKDAGPGETSRAMAVHARTLEFYRQLGIADDITGRGLKVQQVSVRESGRLKGAFAFGDLGAGLSAFPFILSFPQDAHEQALLAHLAAAGVTVERDTELIAYHQTPTEVRATLRTPAGPRRPSRPTSPAATAPTARCASGPGSACPAAPTPSGSTSRTRKWRARRRGTA
jgi:2-polyprenyl-6-methoxyphenol hydroxylase-like FAD-dependent oxidoreductase